MSLERPVDFSEQIEHFRAAAHGEDVRCDLIEIAEVLEDAVNEQLIDVDGTLTQSGQGADAKTVGDILYGGGTHTGRTPTPTVHYTGTLTTLMDLPLHCWKLVLGGNESSPADGTLRKMLASEDETYFPWLSVFSANIYYRLTRKETMVAGGSQFIIEGLAGNPRFYGVLPIPEENVTQTAADIVWYNRSITSDLTEQGAAAHAKTVGDAIFGAGESHAQKLPRIMTQFSGMASLAKLDDMPPWTVGTITGAKFRTLQDVYSAADKFPDLTEIPNDDTTFYLEKKRYQLSTYAKYANQYLLYRTQRTTIWAGYTSATDRPGDDASAETKAAYVQKVKWNKIVQLGAGTAPDGQTPTYVSIGASTVYGSVNEPGGVNRRSANRFPVYVANALHMQLADLSVGSTGFIRRGSNGLLKNFMDQIFDSDNAAAFAAAGLVSIVFGYGNDADAGLPIGEYDDFYPFDTKVDGAYYYQDTVANMISKGATFFGCLNWCIKYLGEHYPKAQLVLIFAAPSQNKGREVTVIDHTPDQSTSAVKKLLITNPYTQSANPSIYKIGQGLKLLQAALSIPIVDTYNDAGNAFTYYQTVARTDGVNYDLFSETGDAAAPTWDRHPNDAGYRLYARYIAGLIVRQFLH